MIRQKAAPEQRSPAGVQIAYDVQARGGRSAHLTAERVVEGFDRGDRVVRQTFVGISAPGFLSVGLMAGSYYFTSRFTTENIDTLSVAVVTSNGTPYEHNFGPLRANKTGSSPVNSQSMYRLADVWDQWQTRGSNAEKAETGTTVVAPDSESNEEMQS